MSKKRLNLSRYSSEINELEGGQQIRINHEDCPEGEDTRRRLYIKLLESNPPRVIAHCFNCGGVGSKVRNKYWPGSSRAAIPPTRRTPIFPELIYPDNEDFPSSVLFVGSPSSPNYEYFKATGGGYDPLERRYIMPIWGGDTPSSPTGTYYGYNARSMIPGAIKYQLNVSSEFPGYQCYNRAGHYDRVDVFVYTEDQLSAASISTLDDSYCGVALFGTKGSLELVHEVSSKGIKNSYHVVWLDNDSNLVQQKAEQIGEYLNLLGRKAFVIDDAIDPKHYRKDTIEEILHECLGH